MYRGVSIRDRSIRARDISTSPRRIYRDSGAWRDCKSPFEDRWYQVLCGTLVGWGVVEWCGVENSGGKTRGDTGRKNGRERNGDHEGWECKRVRKSREKREREMEREIERKGELLGRNKLARNERQIASELSARSPNVIEVRGPSWCRLLLPPLFHLPSFYHPSSPLPFLLLSSSLPDILGRPILGLCRGKRETEDVGSSPTFSPSPPPLVPFRVSPTTLTDGCRYARDRPPSFSLPPTTCY